MSTEKPTQEPPVADGATLVCAVWGPLDARDRHAHMDCPVIVSHAYEGVGGSPARTAPLPMICSCECHTCKRAWWTKGRPILRDGVIIYGDDGR